MSLVNSNAKVKVELCKRISDWKHEAPIWESTWVDISEYFVETVTDYNFSIDDNNLTGKYSQESINIKFSNRSGAFNKPAIEGSLWRKGQYMYHSRIRVYEWAEDTEEPAAGDLVIDGLIANYSPRYYLNGDCNLMVNSKLDMLRDHFLVTEQNAKSTNASSQGILNYIVRLYDLYYSELDVKFAGCVFYNNVEFDGLAAYEDTLLDLFFNAVDSSGGYGGMINNTFFSSFVGAPQIEGANFTETNFPVSIYHFDDTDAAAETTVYDQLGSNDLTIANDWKEGLFTNAARNFVLYGSSDILPEITTEYSVEMVVEIEYNKLFPVQLPLVFGASSTETGLYPLFAFSSDGTTAEIVIADFAANYYIEGFFIDKQYKVFYGRGQVSGNSFAFSNYVELGQLDSNNMYQYLVFSQNSNGDVSFFKNGRFVSGFRDVSDVGAVQSGTVALTASNRKRICGYGYFNRKNTATLKYEDTCAIYYSGLKINYREMTDENCFDTYINLFSRRAV